MGICGSTQSDLQMDMILLFVKYAYSGDIAMVEKMIKQDKISPNVQDRFGLTALHWAAYGGKLACISTLLANGASPTIVDHNGRNALHHACRKDHEETVRYLVTKLTFDVNSRSESKDTPLHKAVLGKSIKSVEALLELGADPHLRNDQNRTPIEELDVQSGAARDDATPTPTVQIEDESNKHHKDFVTEVSPQERRGFKSTSRRSDAATTHFQVASIKYGPSKPSDAVMTAFHSRLSECSDSSPRQPNGQKGSGSDGPTAGDISTEGSKRSLKYVVKRVIMALRAKKIMSSDEKRQMIRLILKKHMKSSYPNHIRTMK